MDHGSPPIDLNQALQKLQAGRPAEALDIASRILRTAPADPEALHLAAMAMAALGRRKEAAQTYEKAHDLYPSAEGIACNLGALHRDAGDDERAAGIYRTLLQHRPASAEAILGLSLCVAPQEGDPSEAALQGLLETDLLSPTERIALLFARANRYHWAGDFGAAFSAYQSANAEQRGQNAPYDLGALDPVVDMLISDLGPKAFEATADWGMDSTVPVFIAGFPRSGKTTLERLIMDHPDCHGAGELRLLQDTAAEIERRMTRAAHARQLHRGTIEFRAKGLLAEMRRRAPSAVKIIDTNPNNLMLLGFAALMFPKAPVIFCLRDPEDTGLSCYASRFVSTQAYSTDLSDTGRFINLGRRLWDHWRTALPNPILEIDFRDIHGDPARTRKRIVNFLGLAPEPSRGKGGTASSGIRLQAADYTAHLAPLRAELVGQP